MKRDIIKNLLPMIIGFSSFFIANNTFAEGGGGGGGGHSGHGGHDSFFHDIQRNKGHFIGESSERKHESRHERKRKPRENKQSSFDADYQTLLDYYEQNYRDYENYNYYRYLADYYQQYAEYYKQKPEYSESYKEYKKYADYYEEWANYYYYEYYYSYYTYYDYYFKYYKAKDKKKNEPKVSNTINLQEWITPGFVTTPLMTNNIINTNGLLTIPTIGSTPGLIIFPVDFTANQGAISTIPLFSQSDYYNQYSAYYDYYYNSYYYAYYGSDPYTNEPYNATNKNNNSSVLNSGLNVTLPQNNPSITFDNNGTPYIQIFTITGMPATTPIFTINNP